MTKCPTERNYLLPDYLDGMDFAVISIMGGIAVPVITPDSLRVIRAKPCTEKLLTASFYQTQAVIAGIMNG